MRALTAPTSRALARFHLILKPSIYVLKPDYNVFMDVQQAINLQLVRSFAEHGIAFAFPTQTLHLNHSAIAGHARHRHASNTEHELPRNLVAAKSCS